MPDPEKFEREPPEVMMSEAVKLIEASERENERLAPSPVARDEMSEEREIVGGVVSFVVVSMLSVRELLGSAPSMFGFPERSEKVEEATVIRPSNVLLALGVNVAV